MWMFVNMITLEPLEISIMKFLWEQDMVKSLHGFEVSKWLHSDLIHCGTSRVI